MTRYELPTEVKEWIVSEAGRTPVNSPRRIGFAVVVCDALDRFPQPCANCGRFKEEHEGKGLRCPEVTR